ncbi:MAG TPA: carboxypeptidase-like regulatory domain-containing protein [Gemmatimonadaceae bacterium]|nr:carboxypeptidase-like regulatory domain-containing protein [Gemmatimonadaceae bacterium]
MKVKPVHTATLLAVALFLLLGCSHVVRRPLECAPPPAPIGKSAIAWQRIGGTRSITGKVVAPGSLTPIQGALVGFAPLSKPGEMPANALQQYSDASGTFRIDSMRPSRYVMSVRRLGYLAVRDTVLVTQDSGLVATGTLVPHNMTIDECGMMYYEVRVPWWKRN